MSPSGWVVRWAPLVTHGSVLDLACGGGRHSRVFLEQGLKVVAVDREPQVIPGARFIHADLEDGSPWPLTGERFEGIVVTNYLNRPLMKIQVSSASGPVYQVATFRPSSNGWEGYHFAFRAAGATTAGSISVAAMVFLYFAAICDPSTQKSPIAR